MNILETREGIDRISRVPTVRRCRGSRIYTLDGKRILDLYAEGGRCALGRTRGAVGTRTKACIDTGLVSGFPSVWERRLTVQIKSWLPRYDEVFVYPSEDEALQALASLANVPLSADFASGLAIEMPFGEFRRDTAEAASPMVSVSVTTAGTPSLVILPLPRSLACGIVAARGSDLSGPQRKALAVARRPAPAFKLAASHKALCDFLAWPKETCEAEWKKADRPISGSFERSGPWLYPKYPESEHDKVFSACLDAGILISPEFGVPSFLPVGFDKGEVAPLKTLAGLLGDSCRKP